jgi:threonine/homoserine efflux transporter RhtA
MSGIGQLGTAMPAAAVVTIPAGLPGAIPAFTHPICLAWGIGVGVCSPVIPPSAVSSRRRQLRPGRDCHQGSENASP